MLQLKYNYDLRKKLNKNDINEILKFLLLNFCMIFFHKISIVFHQNKNIEIFLVEIIDFSFQNCNLHINNCHKRFCSLYKNQFGAVNTLANLYIIH